MPELPLSRRTLLRGTGACIGLPLLDAMLPIGLRADERAAALRTKRMVLINRPLGMHAPLFFPEKPGPDYEATRLLTPLQEFRRDFTVFSGMSHRGYNAGHGSGVAILTGVAPEGLRFPDLRNTISLDQEVASRLGAETRFPYLSLGGNGGGLSWNRKGVRVPSEGQATRTFKELFVDGTPDEVARAMQRIQVGYSILDGVREQAKALAATLGPADRNRLDLLLTSIREAEQRLQQDQDWVKRPKPKVAVKPFTDDYYNGRMLERSRQWYDLVHLALETDSTRVIALELWSHVENLNLEGVTLSHHDASHHGQDDSKIKQLALIEEAEMKLLAGFLKKMQDTNDGGPSLLDQTIVFHASNLGNASAHTNDNLPIILAGGGFKHAGHVAFDRKNNMQLSNLFVRMLQQMGLEMDRFGSSTGIIDQI